MAEIDLHEEHQAQPNDLLQRALEDAEQAFMARTPKSGAEYERACAVLPGGNTRTVIHFSPYPVRIVHAEGAMLSDVDGNSYCDFLGEYSAGLYGHSEPKIIEAAHRALDDGIVFGGPNLNEIELAELMCERFPSVERVRFTNSGHRGQHDGPRRGAGAHGARRHPGVRGRLSRRGALHGALRGAH